MATYKPKTRKYDADTIDLNKKLIRLLIILVLFLIVITGSLVFFAPQVGSFFGLFSVNRNKEDEQAVVKPSSPVFSKIPKATKDESININGYAQPGLMVKLFVNGPEASRTTVGADGLFTFSSVHLINGRNTIFAKTTDSKGIESDPTNVFDVIVDKEKPKLEIASPKDGDTIKNLDKRIDVTGNVNEKARITVNGKTAIVKPDLTFEFLLGVSGEGSIKITVIATDEAGNETKKEFTVKYEKESY